MTWSTVEMFNASERDCLTLGGVAWCADATTDNDAATAADNTAAT